MNQLDGQHEPAAPLLGNVVSLELVTTDLACLALDVGRFRSTIHHAVSPPLTVTRLSIHATLAAASGPRFASAREDFESSNDHGRSLDAVCTSAPDSDAKARQTMQNPFREIVRADLRKGQS